MEQEKKKRKYDRKEIRLPWLTIGLWTKTRKGRKVEREIFVRWWR
jgi:hypothetical protein